MSDLVVLHVCMFAVLAEGLPFCSNCFRVFLLLWSLTMKVSMKGDETQLSLLYTALEDN